MMITVLVLQENVKQNMCIRHLSAAAVPLAVPQLVRVVDSPASHPKARTTT